MFDSGQQDINFTTIYSENQFFGMGSHQRRQPADRRRHLALSRRRQRRRVASVGLAQRYYFETQRVTLPGVAPRTNTNSDLLAALSGNIAPHWTVDAGLAIQHRSLADAEVQHRRPLPAEAGQGAQRELPRNHQYPAPDRRLDAVAGRRGLDRPRALELLAAATTARSKAWSARNTMAIAGCCAWLPIALPSPPRRLSTTVLPAARIERHVAYRL